MIILFVEIYVLHTVHNVILDTLVHLIKYALLQAVNSRMFWHQGAILRESFKSNKYKPNMPI